MKMGPGVFTVLRTKDDNWQGQPYGERVIWWIPAAPVKIGTLLNVELGAISDVQILDPNGLDAAHQ